MLLKRNIYVLNAKYRCFIRADYWILLRRQLELVPLLIGITLRIDRKSAELYGKVTFSS